MRKSLAAALVTGVLGSACTIDVNGAGTTVFEEKTFQVAGQPELVLRTSDGAIEVRSWDRNEVRVEIQRRAATAEEAKALEVNTSQDGNRIVIDAPGRPRRIHIGSWSGEAVSFIVRAPRQVKVEAHTGDGAISVEDLSGTITLETGDGSIRGGRVQGDLSAHTGDGSIAITDAAGRLDLDTGDGSVRLTGKLEALRVHTGDGSVTVDVLDGSQMTSDWSLTTGDGSISATLPNQFSAEVDVKSGDGIVSVNGASGNVDDRSDGGSFRGRVGAGGRTLSARSGDGSITIASR